jgi:hypothetical protein
MIKEYIKWSNNVKEAKDYRPSFLEYLKRKPLAQEIVDLCKDDYVCIFSEGTVKVREGDDLIMFGEPWKVYLILSIMEELS